MSTLIKVTFSATSGEEVSGKAQIDRGKGIVTLPARFSVSIDRARNAGEGFEIVAHDNGYRYPLSHQDADRYKLKRTPVGEMASGTKPGGPLRSHTRTNVSSMAGSRIRCRRLPLSGSLATSSRCPPGLCTQHGRSSVFSYAVRYYSS